LSEVYLIHTTFQVLALPSSSDIFRIISLFIMFVVIITYVAHKVNNKHSNSIMTTKPIEDGVQITPKVPCNIKYTSDYGQCPT